MARSIKTAATVLAGLREPNRWELFEAVAQINDKRKTDATLLLDDVRSWLKMDEFALVGGLASKLSEAEGRAIQLLKPPKSAEREQSERELEPESKLGWRRIDSGTKTRLALQDLARQTGQVPQ